MSNMKDYAMWLDSRGIATWDESLGELSTPDGVDIYSEELIEKYNADDEWHTPESDQYLLENPDEWGWSPEDFWFKDDGGLTAEAYEHLHNEDSNGDFV
tara:strand:- start:437 stop:733 length:297 start_codon:yes stop_codon:yes gene_type:complete